MARTDLTYRLRVFGIVQGVGFRPTVARHAARACVRGFVCNKGPYVEIVCQGTEEETARFVDLVEHEPPRRSAIIQCEVTEVADACHYPSFEIVESERTKGAIFVSPDIAICDECARELFDPADRRYLHPFVNCTNCGPRLTILDRMPYDRERTSMASFPMCPACAAEYHDPASRRYDAQPVCCNDCGPKVSLLDRPERGPAAISEARRIIAAGGIVAVKGIGGFHLCCDATSEEAVSLLRRRKRRPAKPFAVMARDMEAVGRACELTEAARELIGGHQRPIVLLKKRASGLVAPSVAPDNPKLGIMCPYAPLQMLLFDYPDGIEMPDLLVMTSANESGAPIARDDGDARAELAQLTDAILTHDRLIRVRADDTVTDLFEDRPYMIRRSRGYAPLPLGLTSPLGVDVLALGGELKNTFCVGTKELCYLSPYVGDLGDVRTVEALTETAARMCDLLEVTPQLIACDEHPAYNSCRVAEELADRLGLPLMRVQHHFAHIVSCMAERGCEEKVIGVALDGTGYGSDGTIWGGEILLADTRTFERVAHIAPFPQPGGDASAREGWRVAAGMLCALADEPDEARSAIERLHLATPEEARMVQAMVARSLNCVTSTSAGRLFDAVSAVLGIRRSSTFEGEAACALQFAAERAQDACPKDMLDACLQGLDAKPRPEGALTLPTDTLFAEIVRRRLEGEDRNLLALAFHVGLARQVTSACVRVAKETGVGICALSGGCFQNTLLLRLVRDGLKEAGFAVLTHELYPPNDGGIALGQALSAARRWQEGCA